MYADRHTVSRLTYSISIDRDTVYQSRYSMSIEIQYVYRDTVCLIEILYVDRLLRLTVDS